jgi:hypothetical protein
MGLSQQCVMPKAVHSTRLRNTGEQCRIRDAICPTAVPATAAQNEVLRSIVVANPQLRALLAVAFSLTGDHNCVSTCQ